MSAVALIDKHKVKQSFALACQTYDGLAVLQRHIGFDLMDKLPLEQWDKDPLIVDLGCGTGFLSQQLVERENLQTIIAIDIALSMLHVAKTKLDATNSIHYICADAEKLPLSNQSVNHIVSNVALQWCQNLAAVFTGFKQVLKQGGTVGFSTFGPATLKELKAAWAEVDDYQHVNQFYSVDTIQTFLQQAGFKAIKIESILYQYNYPTVIALMKELKGIGAHNVLSGRNKKLTSKTDMQKMIAAYKRNEANDNIIASYEMIFVTAQAE